MTSDIMSSEKNKNLNQNGFTILEMIVVIFIISLAMIGVMSLVGQNIQAQYINKNDLIASQLAQEGLEIVRSVRDSNWKNNYPWDTNLDNGSYVWDYRGAIDMSNRLITDPQAKLYLRTGAPDNGFYWSGGSGIATNFSRIVTINNKTSTSTVVSCLVQWKEKGKTHNYKAETALYDWK